MFGCIFTRAFSDFHAAKVRTAHRTKMRGLLSLLRERVAMKFARGFGIERGIELVVPTKFI
jgi:hypothetical protein